MYIYEFLGGGVNLINISITELKKDILPHITEEDIKFDEKHFKKVKAQRNASKSFISDCLLRRYPKIIKLKPRKFKLCYRLPGKIRRSTLIVIIKVPKSKRNILVKTAYDRNVKRKADC